MKNRGVESELMVGVKEKRDSDHRLFILYHKATFNVIYIINKAITTTATTTKNKLC